MVADHHAAAAGRRPLLTLKPGGCAIPPMTRHAVFPFLVVVSPGTKCHHAAVFARMTTIPESCIIAT
jgi:hypothetical protein